MADASLTLSIDAGVARLAPHAAGSLLTPDAVAEIAGTLAGLADRPDVRVAVLDSTGGGFLGGWDAEALRAACPDPAGFRRLAATMHAIATSPLPTVAALNGAVVGGSFELALCCDVRVASARSRFGFPAGAAGVFPAAGGAARLARAAGRGTAAWLLLTGDTIDAAEAQRHGIIRTLVPAPELSETAARIATAIAARGPIAVRYAKEAVRRGVEMPLEQALRFETDLTIILQSTADRAEGVAAFVEKRPPRFGGR